MALLHIENLNISFKNGRDWMNVVTDLSFDIEEGKSVALVGESGCGKSVTSMSIMRLLNPKSSRVTADRMEFNGKEMQKIPERQMWKLRGEEIAMIFQEPMTSLNPVTTIGSQLVETIMQHKSVTRAEAKAKALQMLKEVGIPEPEQRMREYPHQMSGGMRQRIMIAMALSCDPKLLIADEPTTALDVTIQAQILELITKCCKERKMALLLITHNMGIVAENADEVMVMYAGRIVERAPVKEIFDNPMHPYTYGLLRAIPGTEFTGEDFYVIRGRVPSPMFFSKACRFAPRCDECREDCKQVAPEFIDMGNGHMVRCHYPVKKEGAAND